MTIRRFVVPVTADESGDAEVYSPHVSGKLVSFRYIKDDFADTVDFVVTSEDTGETLWSEENVTASATRHPRVPTQTTGGVDAVYAGGSPSGPDVLTKIALGVDRIKFVVANAGDGTSGTFHITIDG